MRKGRLSNLEFKQGFDNYATFLAPSHHIKYIKKTLTAMSLSRNHDPVIQDKLKTLFGAVSCRCAVIPHRGETCSIPSVMSRYFLLHGALIHIIQMKTLK